MPHEITIERLQRVQAGYDYLNFEHKTLKNKDGSRLRARANGQLKLWKTRPTEFRIPCKHGLKDYFYITQDNAHEWEIV
jgi:hypothetical protein